MMTSYCLRSCLHRILSQSLVVCSLAAIGLLSGLTPGLSKNFHTLVFSSSAHAQDVSAQELQSYVMVSKQIELMRRSVYNEIKKVNGGNVPNIPSCSLQGLSDNIRPIWQRFCEQSQEIIQRAGFSNSRYNAITRMRQEDPDLERRVREAAGR